MQTLRYRPFDLVASLGRDADRLIRAQSGTRRRFVPAIDIVEEDARYVVEADLPGIDAAAIDITVEGDLLTIRGERKAPQPADGAAARRAERASGPFERVFRLPETAAGDGIEASYRHGVLTVLIPKSRDATPYRIEVTAN